LKCASYPSRCIGLSPLRHRTLAALCSLANSCPVPTMTFSAHNLRMHLVARATNLLLFLCRSRSVRQALDRSFSTRKRSTPNPAHCTFFLGIMFCRPRPPLTFFGGSDSSYSILLRRSLFLGDRHRANLSPVFIFQSLHVSPPPTAPRSGY